MATPAPPTGAARDHEGSPGTTPDTGPSVRPLAVSRPSWATRADPWKPAGPGRWFRWCGATLADGQATVEAIQEWDGAQPSYDRPVLTVPRLRLTATAAETARLDAAWTAVVATMRQADALAEASPTDTARTDAVPVPWPDRRTGPPGRLLTEREYAILHSALTLYANRAYDTGADPQPIYALSTVITAADVLVCSTDRPADTPCPPWCARAHEPSEQPHRVHERFLGALSLGPARETEVHVVRHDVGPHHGKPTAVLVWPGGDRIELDPTDASRLAGLVTRAAKLIRKETAR